MSVDALFILDSVLLVGLLVFLVICGITDVLYQKVWNVVTFPAMVFGLAVNALTLFVHPAIGMHNLLGSGSAFLLGFAIFFVIHLVGGMGGGDVKFVAAVGAFDPFHFGYVFILWDIFYSVMAGGLIAIVVMTFKGRLLSSLRNVFRTVFTFLAPGLEHEPLKPEDSDKIPFGLGIAFGTLWTIVLFHIGALPN